MWFSPDCSTCSALYDLGRNENFARSLKANLNYLIYLKLYDFLISFRMHYDFLWKDSVNKQDTCFRFCKIPNPSHSFKAFGDMGHVITHKHPAPVSFPISLGQFLSRISPGVCYPWDPFYIKFQKKKKKDEWALRVSKELLGNPQLVSPRQGTQHTWILVVLYPVCMTLDELPNF